MHLYVTGRIFATSCSLLAVVSVATCQTHHIVHVIRKDFVLQYYSWLWVVYSFRNCPCRVL